MTDSALLIKYDLINESEAEWVQSRVDSGVPVEDAVAELRAARVGPASLHDDPGPAPHVPGGQLPTEPSGALTEPEPIRFEPLTVAEAEAELEDAKSVLVEAKAREKEAADNAKAAAAEARRGRNTSPSAPGVAAEEANPNG